MFMYNPGYLLLVVLPTVVLTLFARWRVESAFRRYSQVPSERGLSGAQTARLLMQHQGLEGIRIDHAPGFLTDHYDPRDKSMHLSEASQGASVAAMAVVAHELGHAEQDKMGNAMLNLRASLVPVANLGSGLGVWIIVIGLGLARFNPSLVVVAWAGVLLFGAMVAFTLVTLPVEFDASRRAKRNLAAAGLVSPTEAHAVDAVLNAAALTYVAAAAASVLQLLYWVTRLTGRSRD